MNRHGAALVLLAAALIAGCTSLPSSGPSNDGGISVTPSDGLDVSLQPADSSFDPQDTIRLELVLANTGERQATVTDLSWGGAPFLTANGCSQDRATGSIPALNPADPAAGEEGDSISILRSCPYPSDSGPDEGSSDTFPATASVTYTYRTVATGSVTIVPDDASGGQASTASSAAPVQVSMTLPAETTRPSGGSLRVPVTVRNVGDGEVSGDVSLSASPGDLDCPSSVTLVGGARSIECTLPVDDSGVERSERIRLQFDYTYVEDVETLIRLSG